MPGTSPLIDAFLPEFDVRSEQSIRVAAPAETVYALAWELDVSASPLVRVLFRMRGLPASALTRAGLERIRFKPLQNLPPRGFVLGIIGRFWTPSGQLVDFAPADFTAFDADGFAKAAWAFEVVAEAPERTLLTTETRVLCLDPASQRRFRLYWFAVGPFSRWIRWEVLRMVKRAAEAGGRSEVESDEG